MADIQIFNNGDFNGNLRTLMEDGKILFVASDVAKMLGYAIPRKAVLDHCKGVLKRNILTNGGNQEVNVIPEGDVYRLITHSTLPAAEKFESWVFDEVLPSIRKDGAYMTPAAQGAALMQQFSDPRVLAGLLNAFADEKDAHAETRKQLAAAQEENEHSREVLNLLDGWGYSATNICNSFLHDKISGRRLRDMMREDGLLSQHKQARPAQQLVDMGLMMLVPEEWNNKRGTDMVAKFVTTSVQSMMPYFNACVSCFQAEENAKRAQHSFDVVARKYMRVTSTAAKAKVLAERKEAQAYLETAQEELELAVQARQDIAVDLLAGNLTPAAA